MVKRHRLMCGLSSPSMNNPPAIVQKAGQPAGLDGRPHAAKNRAFPPVPPVRAGNFPRGAEKFRDIGLSEAQRAC
jgi:hypothetical protein